MHKVCQKKNGENNTTALKLYKMTYFSLNVIQTSRIKTPHSFEAKVSVVIATASVFAGFLVYPVPSTVVSVFRTYTACVIYEMDVDLVLPKHIPVYVKG